MSNIRKLTVQLILGFCAINLFSFAPAQAAKNNQIDELLTLTDATSGINRAIETTQKTQIPPAATQLRQTFQARTPEMRTKMLSILRSHYATFSDAELTQTLAFLKSPAGHKWLSGTQQDSKIRTAFVVPITTLNELKAKQTSPTRKK